MQVLLQYIILVKQKNWEFSARRIGIEVVNNEKNCVNKK